MSKGNIVNEILNLQNNKKTVIKFNGAFFLLMKKENKIIVDTKQPLLLKIFSVVILFVLTVSILSNISFSYTDEEKNTHLFSGGGFLYYISYQYHIFFLAFMIYGGVFISNNIYRKFNRKKMDEFKRQFILI